MLEAILKDNSISYEYLKELSQRITTITRRVGAMFPLNGGNLMMPSSCVRLIVVIPCTLGLELSMRAGLEHMSVSHVLRAVAALSTSISKWDKAVKPF